MPTSRAASSRERPMASRRSRIIPPKICRQARRLTDEEAWDWNIKLIILKYSYSLDARPVKKDHGALIELQGEYALREGVNQSLRWEQRELNPMRPRSKQSILNLRV